MTWNVFLYISVILLLLVCFFLILLVLIQKGRGGGLASAFGGGGGNTAFGSKTGDVLTWATSIIFGVFLILAVILNLMTRYSTRPSAAGNLPAGNPVQMPQQPSRPQPPRDTTPAPTIPLDHPSTPPTAPK